MNYYLPTTAASTAAAAATNVFGGRGVRDDGKLSLHTLTYPVHPAGSQIGGSLKRGGYTS